MIVYRVCSSKYSDNISGESSRKQRSNRWNSYGTPMLYTSDSPALCAVEMYQYIPPSFVPLDYSLLKIEIPDADPLLVDGSFFTDPNWIYNTKTTQSIGDYFINENKYLIMKVPCAMITDHCFNYLINPMHEDFKEVKILETLSFPVDGKLFNR